MFYEMARWLEESPNLEDWLVKTSGEQLTV